MCHHLTFMTFCWTTLQLMQIILVVTNAKYRSAEIQNELIHMAANQSRESICREARQATMIAFMVDESKDVSRNEQLSICVCYIQLPKLDIHEEFCCLSTWSISMLSHSLKLLS